MPEIEHASNATGDRPSRLASALGGWLASRIEVDGLRVVSITPVSGGLVNDVRRVDISFRGGEASYLLRWDPVEGPYAPYDVALQFERFVRLRRTDLPVPEPLWLETDPDIIGRAFWISEFIEAETPGRLLDPDHPRSAERRRAFVDMLARIHGADWRGAGMGEVCPVLDPAALRASLVVAADTIDRLPPEDRALFGAALDRLKDTAPASYPLTLTHGDCSLSNYMFRGDRVVAVLDWDLVRITDPVLDLGYYCAISDRFQMDRPLAVREAMRRKVVDAYAARTAVRLDTLPFWELHQTMFAALSWLRPGWGGQPQQGFAAYRARLAELMATA